MEETPKIDSELEAAIASEDPFSYYDDDASEEEMDDDIALLAAGKTMAHEDYAYTDVSSGTEYMVDLYTDHTAKIWKLITSSGGASVSFQVRSITQTMTACRSRPPIRSPNCTYPIGAV